MSAPLAQRMSLPDPSSTLSHLQASLPQHADLCGLEGGVPTLFSSLGMKSPLPHAVYYSAVTQQTSNEACRNAFYTEWGNASSLL